MRSTWFPDIVRDGDETWQKKLQAARVKRATPIIGLVVDEGSRW